MSYFISEKSSYFNEAVGYDRMGWKLLLVYGNLTIAQGGIYMTWENPTNEEIASILRNTKTIAVVGLSDNPERTSYQVSKAMQDDGYKIIPVNPMVDTVLGEKAYNSLVDIKEDIDIINVFRRSEYLPDIAEDALKTDCRIFWAQQGVINEEAYHLLKENGFTVMMDLCIKVVHSLFVKS